MAPQSNKRRQAKDEKFGELSVMLCLLLLLLCTLASNAAAELQRYMPWEKMTVMLNMQVRTQGVLFWLRVWRTEKADEVQ
jgi:hypothetical protein